MARKKISLSTNFRGLRLKNPVVLCSGTAGFGLELEEIFDFKNIGAIVTKTLTLRPQAGNPPPRIAETASGVLNSIGLENLGLKSFLGEFNKLKRLPADIIVSVYAHTKEDFKKMILRLDEERHIKAIELNFSCPNLRIKKMISQSAQLTASFVKYIRKATKKVLIAKLTPEVTDIVKVAKSAYEAGIDGLSLVNTFSGIKIDTTTKKPFLGNVFGGLSGPAIKPLALARVFRVYKELKIPIIASGGIFDYQDALEFIFAGATCIGLGTANLIDPDAPRRILKDLTFYMERNRISSLEEIRGVAHG
ncbi:MAG: dihydroorotate dehydrogenase [Candidatus Omnitrophica bacterium]|nr:dihydroorotate dehydrogenase [Candidatus Omnitrophota bacterium]